MPEQESDPVLEHAIFGASHPLGVTYGNRLASELSRGAFDGAGNLLRKAMGALHIGKADQARRYVERAVAIPFDDFERHLPAAAAAHMMVFSELVDALEATTEGDTWWIDQVSAAAARCEGDELVELQGVLAIIAADYEVSRSEHRAIQRLCANAPDVAPLLDVDTDSPDLLARIESAMRVGLVLREEFGAVG